MAQLSLLHWLLLLGCGALWAGAQIVIVSGGPRLFQGNPPPLADKGTPQRFGQFWIDQYAWIGVSFAALGFALIALGVLA